MATAGSARADREVVANQLAAAAGENRRAFNKACTLLLAVAGGESSDAAALREHAAENRDAAVTSGIVRVQSATDCDGDAVAEGNVSAESSEKMISTAVADPPDVKPAPPRTTGNTADQNRLKPCRGRPFGLQSELESESKKEIPVESLRAAGNGGRMAEPVAAGVTLGNLFMRFT